MSMVQQQTGMRKRRPLGVTILAILIILFGIFAILEGLTAIGFKVFGVIFSVSVSPDLPIFYGILAIVLGIAALIVGGGLWGLQRWAWWLGVIVGVIQIIVYGSGLDYINLALWAIIVIYLIAVRKAFMGARGRPSMP